MGTIYRGLPPKRFAIPRKMIGARGQHEWASSATVPPQMDSHPCRALRYLRPKWLIRLIGSSLARSFEVQTGGSKRSLRTAALCRFRRRIDSNQPRNSLVRSSRNSASIAPTAKHELAEREGLLAAGDSRSSLAIARDRTSCVQICSANLSNPAFSCSRVRIPGGAPQADNDVQRRELAMKYWRERGIHTASRSA